MEISRLLPMEGARNIRDLGNYPARGGKTRPRVFLRGDSTSDLTDRDVALLREMGVTFCLDLRSKMETARAPSRLADAMGYQNIPMLDHIQSGPGGQLPHSMGELYESLLEHAQGQYREIFLLLSEQRGGVLFHCTAGKDRTGVLAMLLLKLAGVPGDVVVQDYADTNRFLQGDFAQQIKRFARQGFQIPESFLRADRENMVYALDRLESCFGGAEKYLKSCGLEDEQLKRILDRFVAIAP